MELKVLLLELFVSMREMAEACYDRNCQLSTYILFTRFPPLYFRFKRSFCILRRKRVGPKCKGRRLETSLL